MRATTYSIVIREWSGECGYIPLTAKTDMGARRQFAAWLASGERKSGQVWLEFRNADGSTGTL